MPHKGVHKGHPLRILYALVVNIFLFVFPFFYCKFELNRSLRVFEAFFKLKKMEIALCDIH